MEKHRPAVRRSSYETDEQFQERRAKRQGDDRLREWLSDAYPVPDWALPPSKRRGE